MFISEEVVELANAVIANAKASVTLLNWDHAVYPTPVEDLVENIRTHIAQYTGWKYTSVVFEGSVLKIETETETLLAYNLKSGHEIYGHICYCGFTLKDIADMRRVIG